MHYEFNLVSRQLFVFNAAAIRPSYSALTLNTPPTKQSSTLTGCAGMVATGPTGRGGIDK